MKHTKKMVMVPESEYLALINALKGTRSVGPSSGDPMQDEKSLIDARIMRNLADSKTGTDIKMKRHSWLYKQRKQLKDLIENKPQRVVIENPYATAPNIAPYMGIHTPKKVKTELKNEVDNEDEKIIKSSPKNTQPYSSIRNVESGQNGLSSVKKEENGNESYSSAPELFMVTPKASKKTSFMKLKTARENYLPMKNIIEKNPLKFGIDIESGEVLTNFNKYVGGSNWLDSLKYITGQTEEQPRGHKFLLQKLKNSQEIRSFFPELTPQQSGQGKNNKGKRKRRIIVQVKTSSIKTPGLFRGSHPNKFKPVLWARL